MNVDLSGIEAQILVAGAGLVLSGCLYLMQRGAAWLNIKISDGQKAAVEDVADKALTFGITETQELIAEKGWDHVDVKEAVIASAGQYAATKFSGTLKRSGVDTSSIAATAAALSGILQRKFPEVALAASASPATPAVPASASTAATP